MIVTFRAGTNMTFIIAPDVKNKTVLVVGGGLTSGHLSLLALRAGCEKVILICRHCLQVKPFDLDLSWYVLTGAITILFKISDHGFNRNSPSLVTNYHN